jgi:lambda repressor-like predicted transcriptional regulator
MTAPNHTAANHSRPIAAEPPPGLAPDHTPLPGPPPLRARPQNFAPLAAGTRAPVRSDDANGDQSAPGPGEGVPGRRLTVPRDAHVTVRALWAAMRMQGIRLDELAARAGVTVNTLSNWRCGASMPRMEQLERALAVVGLQVTVEPRHRGN